MRLGVLDVGSNTVHLLVVDAHPGARPVPSSTHKTVVRMMRFLTPDGAISDDGVERLTTAIASAVAAATAEKVDELLPFATSALRDATNGAAVFAHIERETGVALRVLTGIDESRLTFLAVRRWYGWSAGRILGLDIGGGSLEIASGIDEYPDLAVSVPLGAGRMTVGFLVDDPPTDPQVAALREHAREVLADVARRFAKLDKPDHVVGTSKTFRSLARLAGSSHDGVGPDDRVRLRRSKLADWVPRLAAIGAQGRTSLPGITPERTAQIVAGAIVAEEAMRVFGVRELETCPWALREGLILRRLDELA
ncbi:Ppx/GppA phosphatase family protein [Pengzhenrongella frigida]|uniref:Ppx/GppA family phosphatase n=1 Tax=Pengzhenrongella frigida TaxID=1259133 RepID=A0A4Q5N2B0_9MICO|nr:Ppx/GppA family phosphatase [Cellulomonas sp. HLT2-17]RYV52270.1 Ppx/GppA family phosphatase [Cellulomonas sp. HLT2-17]